MDIQRFGPGDGDDLVVILGWGNKRHHDTVQWFIDRLVEAGYRVHAAELPAVISRFDDEYVAPLEAYVADLDEFRLLGHSTGGLIAAYLEGASTETYCSPWWGYREATLPAGDHLLGLVGRIPTERPVLPKARWGRVELGALATDRQIAETPDRIAPAFIRTTREAQRHRPAIDDTAVVFCTLRERIVCLRSIADGVPTERTVLYDGGHELFSSSERDRIIPTVLDAVENGATGLAK